MPTLLVLGATSDMARHIALRFAREGWDLQVAGRDAAHVDRLAHDVAIRSGRSAQSFAFDALDEASGPQLWESLPEKPEAVLCAVGFLGDQQKARHDPALAQTLLRSNFTGLVPILSLAANHFEQQGHGAILGISSVAGDRGRASNYLYGSAKAGFTAFLSGLRQRLSPRGVQVLTIKPGFVDTRMTEDLNLPAILTASPDQVAGSVWQAFVKKRNILYIKPIWSLIMLAIRLIPEAIFKRLAL